MTSNVKITSGGITCTNCRIDVSGGNIYSDTPLVNDISNIVPTTQWISDYISGLTGIPIGGIIMWNGPTVPTGWALCDGTNETPNLSGRFILGSGNVTDSSGNIGNYSLGQTQGQIDVRLSVDEIPAHSHTINDPGHRHETKLYYALKQFEVASQDNVISSLSNTDNTTTQQTFFGLPLQSSVNQTGITINNTGGGTSHNNMPPYYVLAYIMRLS